MPMTVKKFQRYVNSSSFKKELKEEQNRKEQEQDLYYEKLGELLENSCPPHRWGPKVR